jgi:hypothetical protein
MNSQNLREPIHLIISISFYQVQLRNWQQQQNIIIVGTHKMLISSANMLSKCMK